MNKHIAIICGGEYSPLIGIEKADFIIACDKGLEYAQKSNIRPNLLVGDFDSYFGEIPKDIERLELPVEKDDTDTMAAIRCAVNGACEKITIYCALGGRLDHLLGNIQAAKYIAEHDIDVCFVDENNEVFVVRNNTIAINKREGFSISVLSISDISYGITIEGAKYPLNNYTMTSSFPIGISNEWKDDMVKVSVNDGIILVVLSKIK